MEANQNDQAPARMRVSRCAGDQLFWSDQLCTWKAIREKFLFAKFRCWLCFPYLLKYNISHKSQVVRISYCRGSSPAKQPVCGDGSPLNLNNFGDQFSHLIECKESHDALRTRCPSQKITLGKENISQAHRAAGPGATFLATTLTTINNQIYQRPTV